ncbi:MAG: tetratricopeptide repeat protein [Spirochaetaceae bacterium]|jgi:tetratricopeptide (TPR) repeat protein|nr:tetratricopeptide repeat protein [Spirochaetaceae bacterium]
MNLPHGTSPGPRLRKKTAPARVKKNPGAAVFWAALLVPFGLCTIGSCVSSAVKAEEYYAIGSAYLDLKKYDEAEAWFNRSKFHAATRAASEYNLGRIAYARARYEEALIFFERNLKIDPENITALTAAAYTCIKTGEFEKAEDYYRRVLALVPESADEGFNYAMVLLAMNKNEEAEQVLIKYNNTENPDALLLLARAQSRLGKPEAADAYSASLLKGGGEDIRLEYAEYLEARGLHDKALEEYRRVLEHGTAGAELQEKAREAVGRLEEGTVPVSDSP